MNQSHNQLATWPHKVQTIDQACTNKLYVVHRGDKCYHCG